MKTIVFTGGGTAGHVTPNLALIAKLRGEGWDIRYIGSAAGIEKEIIERENIPFYPISSGKLRRYFDLKNFKDPFRVLKGVYESYRLLRRLKPAIVFSKGGFVSVPVVCGSKLNRIPVIIHESDITPGLANRLSIPLATKVCVTFPESLAHVQGQKAVLTGLPIRDRLMDGSVSRGRALCDFHSGKPVVLVMGGSLGSQAINQALREDLPRLLEQFQIVHLCGKGNVSAAHAVRGYKQFEYVSDELADLLAMSELVVSRAGATSIFEFLALQKPMLLIPLTLAASRGDQILNARSFAKAGYADVLEEEALGGGALAERIEALYAARDQYRTAMSAQLAADATSAIVGLIEQHRLNA